MPKGVYRHVRRDLAERFFSKVRVGAPNECWPWLGPVNKDGRGIFRVGREQTSTTSNRVALRLRIGRPARGRAVQTCRNPPCCNPAHHVEKERA